MLKCPLYGCMKGASLCARYVYLSLLFGCLVLFHTLTFTAQGALPPIWVSTNILGLENGELASLASTPTEEACMPAPTIVAELKSGVAVSVTTAIGRK